MRNDLINAKPVSAAVREVSSALAAVAVHGPDQPAVRDHHKRRVSRWPGRLTVSGGLRGARRAPDPLRRVCPIETPEGPNIG